MQPASAVRHTGLLAGSTTTLGPRVAAGARRASGSVRRQSGTRRTRFFGHFASTLYPPFGRDVADHSLAAFVHNYAFDPENLRALATLAIQGLDHVAHRPAEVRGVLAQLARDVRVLTRQRGPAQALQRRVVQRDSLRGQHPFDFIRRLERGQGDGSAGDVLGGGAGINVAGADDGRTRLSSASANAGLSDPASWRPPVPGSTTTFKRPDLGLLMWPPGNRTSATFGGAAIGTTAAARPCVARVIRVAASATLMPAARSCRRRAAASAPPTGSSWASSAVGGLVPFVMILAFAFWQPSRRTALVVASPCSGVLG